MKLLELEIDDAIFEKLKGFLEILPKTKVKVKEIFETLISLMCLMKNRKILNED